MPTTVYHVEAHKRGWQVRREGSSKPSSVEDEKNDAISEGRDLINKGRRPARLIIHGRRGDVINTLPFPKREQATQTA